MMQCLVILPPGSERIVDADEEVFLLYSRANSSSKPRGLGFVDNRQDVLSLSFELKPLLSTTVTKGKGKRKHTTTVGEKTIEIQLLQDKTALRSRAGDTGSVVWQASIDFAKLILQEQYVKLPTALFDCERIRTSHVLELGSGTGLLGIALSQLFAHYTITDISELQTLITKNLKLNFPRWPGGSPTDPGHNISALELNWQTLETLPPSRRGHYFALPDSAYDLVLVVDCIYHPSLLPSLVGAIDYVTTTGKTEVVVVMELRAEDVTREFLERWLAAGNGEWDIWRAATNLEETYVVWVGRKRSTLAEVDVQLVVH
ncbi:hypothetical protein MIND_00352700 [Mycena indigotica]|uniref:Methyltransferase-domain-containing protein n=1 Tax=Mycena indigotica TaxID=2126181 RepID=A0A8H6T187_9AGAR|nr:uncharacterized protein MIND_00352700 [Mycena indigotica]KAF7309808.1 hypothetical protein MIND_00352700 [Mycena indigotica]